MPPAHVSRRRRSLIRGLVPALVLSLLPLATAFAEPNPYVRVTREGTDIRLTQYGRSRVMLTAQQGTVLEVMHIDGDRYAHRESNWYWVLLPPDLWGRRLAGWVRGHAVEHVPPPATAAPPGAGAGAGLIGAPQERNTPGVVSVPAPGETAVSGPAGSAAATRAPVEATPGARATVPDVVVNFPFDRSDLTNDARSTLSRAVEAMKANVHGMTLVLEGHADSTGPEAYNEQLARARGESVRRYLTDQLQIPAGQVGVVSYGESNPVAPNTTPEGRARNRRVVIKVGS